MKSQAFAFRPWRKAGAGGETFERTNLGLLQINTQFVKTSLILLDIVRLAVMQNPKFQFSESDFMWEYCLHRG